MNRKFLPLEFQFWSRNDNKSWDWSCRPNVFHHQLPLKYSWEYNFIVSTTSSRCHLLITIFKTVLEKITILNNYHDFVLWKQILLVFRCTLCIVHFFLHNIKLSAVADYRSGLINVDALHQLKWLNLSRRKSVFDLETSFLSILCFEEHF